MAIITEKGAKVLKRVESEDLTTLANEVKKSQGPIVAACLHDAAKLIKTLKEGSEED